MLSARAYSFRMQSRLAISLSWIAGYVNVIGWLVCGVAVSHMSGNATHFGQGMSDAIAKQTYHGALFFGFVTLCFLVGAAMSGAMTELARRHGRRSKYIIPMAAEAILLALFAISLQLSRTAMAQEASELFMWLLAGAASMAMGLQNATITRISGAVVRTTHLTGVLTDLGLEGMQLLLWYRDKLRSGREGRTARVLALTRRHPTALRIALLASIFGSFVFGATVGAIIYERWPAVGLLPPLAFLMWIVITDWRQPIADVRELDVLADEEIRATIGDVKSLLPPTVGIYRLTCHRRTGNHGAPDFQAWVDRLPKRWRVLILAVSPLTHFDSDAVQDLVAATKRLHEASRRLILCGVTRSQFKVLRDNGFLDLLDVADVCTDLEFAIARSLQVAR
jgi:uncharacterized membrane protein YoaK (UPF0700 family)/anti-anti-sigma regulatory factor